MPRCTETADDKTDSVSHRTPVIIKRTTESPSAAAKGAATLSGSILNRLQIKITTNIQTPIKMDAKEEDQMVTEKDCAASDRVSVADADKTRASVATTIPPITAKTNDKKSCLVSSERVHLNWQLTVCSQLQIFEKKTSFPHFPLHLSTVESSQAVKGVSTARNDEATEDNSLLEPFHIQRKCRTA